MSNIPEEYKNDPEKYMYDHVLKGKYKHYCCEWDYMAIDETCPEFLACSCWEIPKEEWEQIQHNLIQIVRSIDKSFK